MQERTIDIEQVLRLIEGVEGIILLDLKGVQSTWREHIDAIYVKMQEMREACGLSEVS